MVTIEEKIKMQKGYALDLLKGLDKKISQLNMDHKTFQTLNNGEYIKLNTFKMFWADLQQTKNKAYQLQADKIIISNIILSDKWGSPELMAFDEDHFFVYPNINLDIASLSAFNTKNYNYRLTLIEEKITEETRLELKKLQELIKSLPTSDNSFNEPLRYNRSLDTQLDSAASENQLDSTIEFLKNKNIYVKFVPYYSNVLTFDLITVDDDREIDDEHFPLYKILVMRTKISQDLLIDITDQKNGNIYEIDNQPEYYDIMPDGIIDYVYKEDINSSMSTHKAKFFQIYSPNGRLVHTTEKYPIIENGTEYRTFLRTINNSCRVLKREQLKLDFLNNEG